LIVRKIGQGALGVDLLLEPIEAGNASTPAAAQ
jgi:hypothetical protein